MSEREILFRGKDLQERNGWMYGFFYKSDFNKRERESGKATLIFTPNCDTFIYVPEYHNSWMVKPETVGQYTGLTDKNGTRIFEGDVIKRRGENFIVYWDEECAGFYPFYDQDNPIGYGVIGEESEVIGNIHDNLELLKGE